MCFNFTVFKFSKLNIYDCLLTYVIQLWLFLNTDLINCAVSVQCFLRSESKLFHIRHTTF